jgi:hypothetical protein
MHGLPISTRTLELPLTSNLQLGIRGFKPQMGESPTLAEGVNWTEPGKGDRQGTPALVSLCIHVSASRAGNSCDAARLTSAVALLVPSILVVVLRSPILTPGAATHCPGASGHGGSPGRGGCRGLENQLEQDLSSWARRQAVPHRDRWQPQ